MESEKEPLTVSEQNHRIISLLESIKDQLIILTDVERNKDTKNSVLEYIRNRKQQY